MASKWDWLRGKFPKVPLEATYQMKIDAVLDSTTCPGIEITSGEFSGCTGGKDCPVCAGKVRRVFELTDQELKDRYVKVRDRLDKITAESKALDLEKEAYTKLFADRFEEAGEANKTFADGVSIGITPDPYPFVKDQAALRAWVKAHDMEEMLTLNYQTLASLVKERLEGKVNEPLPDGVDVFMKDKLTCRGRSKT